MNIYLEPIEKAKLIILWTTHYGKTTADVSSINISCRLNITGSCILTSDRTHYLVSQMIN